MVKPVVSSVVIGTDMEVRSLRAIRGCSGTARIFRTAHELGRPLLLELTTPVCKIWKGVPDRMMAVRESEVLVVVKISGTT